MRRKSVIALGSSSPVVQVNGQATAVSSPELPAWVQQSAEPSGVPKPSGGAARAVGKTFTRKCKAANGLSTKQPASKDGPSSGKKKKKGSKSQELEKFVNFACESLALLVRVGQTILVRHLISSGVLTGQEVHVSRWSRTQDDESWVSGEVSPQGTVTCTCDNCKRRPHALTLAAFAEHGGVAPRQWASTTMLSRYNISLKELLERVNSRLSGKRGTGPAAEEPAAVSQQGAGVARLAGHWLEEHPSGAEGPKDRQARQHSCDDSLPGTVDILLAMKALKAQPAQGAAVAAASHPEATDEASAEQIRQPQSGLEGLARELRLAADAAVRSHDIEAPPAQRVDEDNDQEEEDNSDIDPGCGWCGAYEEDDGSTGGEEMPRVAAATAGGLGKAAAGPDALGVLSALAKAAAAWQPKQRQGHGAQRDKAASMELEGPGPPLKVSLLHQQQQQQQQPMHRQEAQQLDHHHQQLLQQQHEDEDSDESAEDITLGAAGLAALKASVAPLPGSSGVQLPPGMGVGERLVAGSLACLWRGLHSCSAAGKSDKQMFQSLLPRYQQHVPALMHQLKLLPDTKQLAAALQALWVSGHLAKLAAVPGLWPGGRQPLSAAAAATATAAAATSVQDYGGSEEVGAGQHGVALVAAAAAAASAGWLGYDSRGSGGWGDSPAAEACELAGLDKASVQQRGSSRSRDPRRPGGLVQLPDLRVRAEGRSSLKVSRHTAGEVASALQQEWRQTQQQQEGQDGGGLEAPASTVRRRWSQHRRLNSG